MTHVKWIVLFTTGYYVSIELVKKFSGKLADVFDWLP